MKKPTPKTKDLRLLKVIEDAIEMLRQYDNALMGSPTAKTPNSTIHGKITPIIHRLNSGLH